MKIALLAAALLAALPVPASACLVIPDPRPVEVQLDEWARESCTKAEAVIEAVVLEGSRPGRPGLLRVERVLKGRLKRGRILTLHPLDNGLCGAGDFAAGERGLTLIGRLHGRHVFQGWLRGDYLQRLDRLGLRPIAAPTLSPRDR